MKKRMTVMLIGVGILFGSIFIYKMVAGYLFMRFMASSQQPAMTVSAMKVSYTPWQPRVNASGSVRAVRGVNVTTEVAGMVSKIYFTPGAVVKEGEILVQLNSDSDIAQLQSLQATAALAKTIYQRDKAQYAATAISKATLDADASDLKNKQALVDQQAALLIEKTIRAPFAGRLGISAVNPGQYINPGDKIVSLQTLDPVYVDFYVPQQTYVQMKVGQAVNVTVDVFPGKVFPGMITTIDPIIDVSTRNVEIEATVANVESELVPGMFASVSANTGEPQRYLTVPQTAVSFNPYGDVVFIVKEKGKDNKGNPLLIATQHFVTTGETRGDQVAIIKGLKEGDTVVTNGQIKLRNETPVVINNTVVPANNPAPKPVDE